jgi:hypothetical protein
MTKLRRRPLLLLTAAALALSGSGYAATGGVHGPQSPGRPSVTPPPWSQGHCGQNGGRPPCNTK